VHCAETFLHSFATHLLEAGVDIVTVQRLRPYLAVDHQPLSAHQPSATVREVAANSKRLGALPGLLLVLHTWGQTLLHHPHVHGVVTGGGLSCNASRTIDANPKWVPCKKRFFLPVRVLSRVFRGKYLEGLKRAHHRLRFFGEHDTLKDPMAFQAFVGPLYRKEWVDYAKKPFGGASRVLKYLAGYTHRVAIGNSRLVSLENGKVSFPYKDYADEHTQKKMTLDACEFLRRFVTHVLPRGFVRIRHYGLLANRFREQRLAISRRLLLVDPIAEAVRQSSAEPVEVETPEECACRRLECMPLPKSRNTS